MSFNLDWQFVLVGAFLAVTVELMGVNALSFAVGAYLPLSTTLPIFAGGALKGGVDFATRYDKEKKEEGELGKGNLFATGLVAGGALMGVIVAVCSATIEEQMKKLSAGPWLNEHLGAGTYSLIGVGFFLVMAWLLYKIARKR
jgi:uncharacterized oligopeptide transporter (OPT) family protein